MFTDGIVCSYVPSERDFSDEFNAFQSEALCIRTKGHQPSCLRLIRMKTLSIKISAKLKVDLFASRLPTHQRHTKILMSMTAILATPTTHQDHQFMLDTSGGEF